MPPKVPILPAIGGIVPIKTRSATQNIQSMEESPCLQTPLRPDSYIDWRNQDAKGY